MDTDQQFVDQHHFVHHVKNTDPEQDISPK